MANNEISGRRLNVTGEFKRQVELVFEIDGETVELQGRYHLLDNLCIVRRISDNVRYDDEVQAWITHLVRCADGRPGITTVSSLKQTEWIAFAGIEQAQAHSLLAPWLEAFYQSHFKGICHNWLGSLGQLYLKQFNLTFNEFDDEEQLKEELAQKLSNLNDVSAANRAVLSQLEDELNPRPGMHLNAYVEQFAANLSLQNNQQNDQGSSSNTELTLPDAFSQLSQRLLLGLDQHKQKVKTKELESFVQAHFYDDDLMSQNSDTSSKEVV